MHFTDWLKLAALPGLLIAGLTACAPPKIMLYETFIPDTDKVARESIKQVGSVKTAGGDDVDLTNYYVQVCDVDGRKETNCTTNLVLENITDYQVSTPWMQ